MAAEDGLLIATQIGVATICVAALALIVVTAARRFPPRRGIPWLPALGVTALLLGSAASLLPGFPEVAGGVIWFVCFPLLMCTYPDGRFVPGWGPVLVLAWAGLMVPYLATGGELAEQGWWLPTIAASWSVLIGFQVSRYRRRLRTAEREQVRWALLGVLVEISAFMVILALTGGIGETGPTSVALAELAGWPIPVLLAVGLCAPNLARVDELLHAVVATNAAGWVLAGIFAGVWHLAGVAGASPDASPWWGALVLALTVYPAFLGARRLADWLVYGRLPSPAAAADRLQRRLAALSPADDIVGAVEQETAAAIRSPSARLTAAGEGIEVVYQGETLGRLEVAPRQSETSLTARDTRVLAALAAQAAPALHGARSLHDLALARSELVRAGAEERKRLRRDLHDDLAPTLAGLGLGASAVLALADPDQLELRETTEALQRGIRDAIAQTRRLAHGLRPAILDDRGLADAVRERARMLAAAGVDARVEVEVGAGLPAAVEVAALLIVQEAIANVVRHARASHCEIALTAQDDVLTIAVRDDGAGLPRSASGRRGLGLGSIRERADELGGRAVISSPPSGGTLVSVWLAADRPVGEPEETP